MRRLPDLVKPSAGRWRGDNSRASPSFPLVPRNLVPILKYASYFRVAWTNAIGNTGVLSYRSAAMIDRATHRRWHDHQSALPDGCLWERNLQSRSDRFVRASNNSTAPIPMLSSPENGCASIYSRDLRASISIGGISAWSRRRY